MNNMIKKIAFGAFAVALSGGAMGFAPTLAHAHTNRARREHAEWVAQNQKAEHPDHMLAMANPATAQDTGRVLSNVHAAIAALENNNHDQAKQLLHDARQTMGNLFDNGVSGVIKTDSQSVPFASTYENLNLAYNQLINSQDETALQTLKNIEADIKAAS